MHSDGARGEAGRVAGEGPHRPAPRLRRALSPSAALEAPMCSRILYRCVNGTILRSEGVGGSQRGHTVSNLTPCSHSPQFFILYD